MNVQFLRPIAFVAAFMMLGGCSTVLAPLSLLQADVTLETATPTVVAIRKSLAIRYADLQPLFSAGAIGFTQDGMIALHDATRIAPLTRPELELLIAEDNKERAALYREIARANGRPDWESQFRQVFAERWIERAPAGWYYRKGSSTWLRKEDKGNKENKESTEPPPAATALPDPQAANGIKKSPA